MSSPALYDRNRARWAFYSDSYQGGEYYREPSCPTLGTAQLVSWGFNREASRFEVTSSQNFRTYLVAFPNETPEEFAKRISLAVYVNVCKPIVRAYADAIQKPVARALGKLEPFLGNLNGRGRTWAQHMAEVSIWTAVYGFTATVIDAPKENPARNRQEEADLGVGPRAIIVYPTAIAWVVVDDDGCLEEFAYVDQPYIAKDVSAQWQTVRLWIFTREGWEARKVRIDMQRGYWEQRARVMGDEKNILDRGELPPGIRGRVPVVFAFHDEVTSSRWPMGTSLIADAADAGRAIYNTLSSADAQTRKTMYSFLAIPQKSASGALPPETAVTVGPSTAFGFPSDTGKPEWVAPDPAIIQALRDHALFYFQLALRTAGLELAADSSGQVQSGQALQVRSRDFDSRAGAYANNLAAYEDGALDLVGDVLEIENDASATYPKRYVLPNTTEDLARAVLVIQTFFDKLGAEGQLEVLRQALDAACSLSDEQLTTIVAETRAKLDAAAQAAAAPPRAPGAFGMRPPPGAPPGDGAAPTGGA